MPPESSPPDGTDTTEDEVTWQSLSVFLEEDDVEDTYNDFFVQIRANHRDVRDLEKRVLQLAIVETAMEHPAEVANVAKDVDVRVQDNTEWTQENLYLPQQTRGRFNDVFFGTLKVEHDALYSTMKRVLQEAALIVGMNHEEEVAERAVEAESEYGIE